MARTRNIKPQFFTNEQLAELEPLARLLYIGLWCLADREGRLEDRPKRIKAQVLPYELLGVNDLLEALAQTGHIVRYQLEGMAYIAIPTFRQHQWPHQNEPPSQIPPPPGHPGQRADAPEASGSSTEVVPEHTGSGIVVAPEATMSAPALTSSLIPHPSSLLTESEAPAKAGPSANGAVKSKKDKGMRLEYAEDEGLVLEPEIQRAYEQQWHHWVDIEAILEAFREYYIDGDGKHTTHVSWGLTLRKWLRDSVTKAQGRGQRRSEDAIRTKEQLRDAAHRQGPEGPEDAQSGTRGGGQRQGLRAILEKSTSSAPGSASPPV